MPIFQKRYFQTVSPWVECEIVLGHREKATFFKQSQELGVKTDKDIISKQVKPQAKEKS